MSGTHLSLMWEQVSKTAHVTCKEQNRASPSAPKRTNCLRVLEQILPHSYYLWALLYILVLFMSLIVLFQLTFTFIYSTFSNEFSISAK